MELPACCSRRSPSESSSESRSRSRSPTPGREEKITFITSFGGSDEEAAAAAAAAAASGAAPGKPPAPPQSGGPTPGRNASARSVTLTLPALHPPSWPPWWGGSGRQGAAARAGADWPSVPHLQPPLLHLLLLLFRLEDLQLPLPLQLQLPLPPRRGLLPLRPPRPLPLPVLVALSVPLPALLEVPQPQPTALGWGLPRRTPLLPFACPACWLRAPAQKQVRGAGGVQRGGGPELAVGPLSSSPWVAGGRAVPPAGAAGQCRSTAAVPGAAFSEERPESQGSSPCGGEARCGGSAACGVGVKSLRDRTLLFPRGSGGGHGLVAESPDCGTAGWAAVLALPGSSQGLLIHL